MTINSTTKVKVLIGIAPKGAISFLSKCYGGRMPDRQIGRESSFLDLINPGDVILADKGFPIREELLLRYAHLYHAQDLVFSK